jgi:predicted  nucleic acid-binding Zn-ribbon protein
VSGLGEELRDIEAVRGFIADAIQPLFLEMKSMLQQITDLKTATDALTAQVAGVKAQDDTLKAAYVAAIANNATLTTQNAQLTAQVAALQAQLASASGLAADDTAALTASTQAVAAATQTLSDTAAADAAGN